jgi:hypothetical protein
VRTPIIRRDKHERCDDCGHPNGGTRVIRFPGGMYYRVCATHEREYVRDHGAHVVRPHWRGPDTLCWCGFRHPLVEWDTVKRMWVPVPAGFEKGVAA